MPKIPFSDRLLIIDLKIPGRSRPAVHRLVGSLGAILLLPICKEVFICFYLSGNNRRAGQKPKSKINLLKNPKKPFLKFGFLIGIFFIKTGKKSRINGYYLYKY